MKRHVGNQPGLHQWGRGLQSRPLKHKTAPKQWRKISFSLCTSIPKTGRTKLCERRTKKATLLLWLQLAHLGLGHCLPSRTPVYSGGSCNWQLSTRATSQSLSTLLTVSQRSVKLIASSDRPADPLVSRQFSWRQATARFKSDHRTSEFYNGSVGSTALSGHLLTRC